MSEPQSGLVRPVPLRLLEGYGRVWVALHGGQIHQYPLSQGVCLVWTSQDGRRQALPDRMYGVGGAAVESISLDEMPAGIPVNLPPGAQSGHGAPTCVTHRMDVSDVGAAWERLKRVGRQGVKKAERTGCQVDVVSDDAYHRLACLKADALGTPPPPASMIGAIREEFGEQLGLTAVVFQGQPIAIVSWIEVDGYGLLLDGASDRAHWDKNPNNLAVWSAIESLMARGVRCVDFGFSPVGSGDAQFKAHMGGQAIDLYQVMSG